jgi:KDO2-lipid IV(A) lauroyltransferase
MDRPIDAPPLRWFLHDAERRRIAWQYWVWDTILGVYFTLSHYALRATSIDTCSWVGDVFGRVSRRYIGFDMGELRRNRRHEAQARANWLRLRPQDNAPAAVEAAMDIAFRNASRSMCEFAVLNRLWAAGRIAVEGAEHLAAARAAQRPILIGMLHLGNWELIGPTLIGLGYGVSGFYQVPPNRFDHRVAVAVRKRFGAKLIPPGRGGGGIAYRILKDNRDVMVIALDEYVEHKVFAPFFGRPVRPEGNIAYAARLATLTDAVLIPAYSLRLDGANFRVTFLPPVELARGGDGKSDLLENVARINGVIEPIILAHLEQWLWLFDFRADK